MSFARRALAVATTVALGFGGVVAVAAPATAAEGDTGTIFGYVSGEAYGEVPAAGLGSDAWVGLLKKVGGEWTLAEYAVTSGGGYTFDELAPGAYTLLTRGNQPSTSWVAELWDDQPVLSNEFENATSIDLAADETFQADVSLTKSATISGIVTGADSGGAEIANVDVAVFDLDTGARVFNTHNGFQDSGAPAVGYSIAGIEPGTYAVHFGTYGGSNYVPEFYDDAASIEDATTVTVEAGDSIDGYDAELAVGNEITGSVHLADGTTPVVDALLFDEADDIVGSVATVAGEFAFNGLVDGDYRVGFSGATVAAEFYNDKATLDEADVIGLEAGESFDIDATVTALKKFTATSTPTITGTPRVGSKLMAKVGGFKPAGATLTYEWKSAGVFVAEGTSYVPTAADKGKKITVSVIAAKEGYAAVTKTSKATKAVASGVLTAVKPKFSGTAKVGATLTAVTGTWKPASVELAYTWLRNGKAITDADGSTYVLAAGDRGKKISLKVTGVANGYATKSVVSAEKTVAYGTLVPAAVPVVTGVTTVGETLTATTDVWAPEGTALSFQWNADKKAITGATESTLVIPGAVAGKRITVTVTGKKTGYTTQTKTSVSTAVVAKADLVAGAAPTIAGNAAYPATLTASATGWAETTKLSYQWLRDGAAITGATKATYAVSRSDRGHTLTVKLTATRTGYNTLTATTEDSRVIPVAVATVNSEMSDADENDYYAIYIYETTPATMTVGGGEYFEFHAETGFFYGDQVVASVAWYKGTKYGSKQLSFTVSEDESTIRVKIPTGSTLSTMKAKKKAGYTVELQVLSGDESDYPEINAVFTNLKF
jgi:hypothetical protein